MEAIYNWLICVIMVGVVIMMVVVVVMVVTMVVAVVVVSSINVSCPGGVLHVCISNSGFSSINAVELQQILELSN